MIKQLDKWHRTRAGLSVFAVAELVIAYGFGSLAIDRGNLWWYLLTLVFLFGSLQNFFRLIGTYSHGRR
jgi:hypothetical protein